MNRAKWNTLLFLAAAGLLTLLLAMSLSSLSLSEGKAFSLSKTDVTLPGVGSSIPGGEALLWVLRGLMSLSVICFSVYALYSLFSAQGRRRLAVNLIAVALLLWIVDYLDHTSLGDGPDSEGINTSSSTIEVVTDDDSSEAALSAGEAPGWLAPVVILVASALAAGLLGASIWFFRQRPTPTPLSLKPLADAAQDTLALLQAGGDFRTAIVQCYREMNRVAHEERGLDRHSAMTPREFETYLVSQGFPRGALETLTRLFEGVRYGNLPPSANDEAQALACLTEIVATCQGRP